MNSLANPAFIQWLGCFIYSYQTLLTGVFAIAAAIYAGFPVWNQLRDSNLQTNLLHRETLAGLLREHLERYARVDRELAPLLQDAVRATHDHQLEAIRIDVHQAFNLDQEFCRVLRWYLVDLKNTETDEIEEAKTNLLLAIEHLCMILNDVHWAAHNDQVDEDRSIPDEEWEKILEKADASELLAHGAVDQVCKVRRTLQALQTQRIAEIRATISKLDLNIASPRK